MEEGKTGRKPCKIRKIGENTGRVENDTTKSVGKKRPKNQNRSNEAEETRIERIIRKYSKMKDNEAESANSTKEKKHNDEKDNEAKKNRKTGGKRDRQGKRPIKAKMEQKGEDKTGKTEKKP